MSLMKKDCSCSKEPHFQGNRPHILKHRDPTLLFYFFVANIFSNKIQQSGNFFNVGKILINLFAPKYPIFTDFIPKSTSKNLIIELKKNMHKKCST